MSYKYKVRIVFFFEVSSDQGFFFWLQIVWVADLTVIFLGNQFFGFVKTNGRDLLYIRRLRQCRSRRHLHEVPLPEQLLSYRSRLFQALYNHRIY